jgi:hypothetical protein
MAATPYEILTFVGRDTGARDYERLKAALEARARGEDTGGTAERDPALDEIRFEVAALRGRVDSIEPLLQSVLRKLDG